MGVGQHLDLHGVSHTFNKPEDSDDGFEHVSDISDEEELVEIIV